MISAIDYLEQRIAELRTEQPETAEGRMALRRSIAELEQIVTRLKLDVLIALEQAIAEDLADPGIEGEE